MRIGKTALSGVITSTTALLSFFCCGYALATPVLGPASILMPMPIPAGPLINYVSPTITLNPSPVGFSGAWGPAAAAPWVAISPFSGTGPYPDSATTASTSTWNFSGAGLPAGTLFLFSDVDDGSGVSEIFTLKAVGTGSTNLTNWLNAPVTIPGFSPTVTQLPKWSEDGTTGLYAIDGNLVPGNPTELFALVSNIAITQLTIAKSDHNFGFGLGAPVAVVSEPGTMALFGLALAGIALGQRRKSVKWLSQ